MTTKFKLFTLVILALFIGGCSKDNPLEMQLNDATNSNAPNSLAKKVAVPVKGNFKTTIENFTWVGPGQATMYIIGTGLVSHLGNCTVAFYQTADFTSTPPSLAAPKVVVTAANGDELYFSAEGNHDSDESGNAIFWGKFNFDGGTGRFMDADGEATFTGSANLMARTGQFGFEGSLKY